MIVTGVVVTRSQSSRVRRQRCRPTAVLAHLAMHGTDGIRGNDGPPLARRQGGRDALGLSDVAARAF